jgi:small-conductance mechanosensitive channel
MEESHVHDIARVIQIALAPAFLLTGVASLLNVFANRLARIVDRTRVLEVRVEPGGDDPAELEILRRRGELVRWSITMGTGAALFVALVIGIAFLGFLLKVNFAMVVAGLFVAAMAALTLALGLFLREVTLAVGSLEAFLPSAIRRARRRRAEEDDLPLGGA